MTWFGADWVSGLRRYLLASLVGHLAWEIAQLPLYTLWRTGTAREIAVAVLHCTAGDIAIAATILTLALASIGARGWPDARRYSVQAACLVLGVGYTVYSEYLNTTVRGAWTYSDLMPVLPWLGTGLAPLLQWLIVPMAALRLASVGAIPTGTLDAPSSRHEP